MTKRLTEKHKEEIMKSFQSDKAIDALSEKYACTVPTIIRNLKKSLGDTKYKEFLNKGKSLGEKSKKNQNQNNDYFYFKLSKNFVKKLNIISFLSSAG